jgi:hypothetical protein
VPTLSALSTFFKEFAKPTGYDFFDARDLRPALIAVGSDLAWLGRTVKERFARAGDSR